MVTEMNVDGNGMKIKKLDEKTVKHIYFGVMAAVIVVVVALCAIEIAMIMSADVPTLGEKGYVLTTVAKFDYPANTIVAVDKGNIAESEIVVYRAGNKYALGRLGESATSDYRIIYSDDDTISMVPEKNIVGSAVGSNSTIGKAVGFLAENRIIFCIAPFFIAGYLLFSIVYANYIKPFLHDQPVRKK